MKIYRKTLIYKTGVEYGDYTLNHVLGCSHGCKYPCYAMLLKKRFGDIKNYDDWIQPRLVANYREILEKELPKYRNKIKTLHLCFTTDPFMYGYEEIINSSIEILHLIANYELNASVLTKGVYNDSLFDLPKHFSFGITLVSLNEDFRKNYEPGAAPYKERIESLKRMKDRGFNTWVSIEPYPTPNIVSQSIEDILGAVKFVDKIIFGKLNYNKLASSYPEQEIYYNNLTREIVDFCKKNNIEYIIKKGTATMLECN